jgi:hypothetical protein
VSPEGRCHVAGVQPNARRRHGTASRFPATLCSWVLEIVQFSPEAARLTLAELIVGAVLASGGHVTQAVLALTPRLGWQAYHWMLERFRLLGLISALCRIVRREIGERRCFAVIDGSLDNGSLDNAEGGRRWRPGARPRRPVLQSASTTRPTPGVPAVPGLCHAVRRGAVPGALGAAGHRPVPKFRQCRQARHRQGTAPRGRRPRACCSTPCGAR